MEKKTIETFIKKYSLNGLVEQVRWVVKDKTLRVTAMTADKKFMTSITMKKFEGLDDNEIGIIDSSRLKQMLGATTENVSLSVTSADDDAKRILSLVFDDGKTEVSHMCGHLDVIPAEPKIKQLPGYDVEITLTEDFIERFSKAKSACPDSELFTLLMNKKKQCLEMVIGYNRNLSNRICVAPIPVVAGKDTVTNPISFSSKNLKEVLSVNTESKDAVLKVSEAGLAFVEFDTPEFQSQYYMIKIDVED